VNQKDAPAAYKIHTYYGITEVNVSDYFDALLSYSLFVSFKSYDFDQEFFS
jgi:hypothetical protein